MIFILNRNEEVINILRNGGAADVAPPFFNDVLSEDLATGAETFSFSTVVVGGIAKDLSVGNYVAFKKNNKYKLFQIMQTEEIHEEDMTINVYCETAGLELTNKVFRKRSMKGVNLKRFLTTILDETGWNVGGISGTSNNEVDLELEDGSVYSTLQNNISKFEVELEFRVEIRNGRIVAKYVDTYSNRGRVTGKRFAFGRDINSIKRTVDSTELFTALIGQGNNDVNFKDVVIDGIDKPAGQDFVADQQSFERYNNKGYHIMGVYKCDSDDPREVLRLTYKQLQKVKDPKISYEVSVALLSQLLGESWNDISIGDTVMIVDNEFNPPIHLSARVSKLDTSFTNPDSNTCTLSNFVEVQTNITNEMRKVASELQGYVDGAISDKFPISGEEIQEGAINSQHIYRDSITTEHLSADLVTAVTGRFENIEAETAKIGELETKVAKIGELEADVARIDEAVINKADINELQVTQGKVQNLEAETAKIKDLEVNVAKIDKGYVNEMFVNNLVAQNGKFQSAHIGTLTSDNIDANTINAEHIAASVIDAINMSVSGKITADKIDANSLVVDNIDAGKITTGTLDANRIKASVISAINASIENATIDSAKIGDLSADKITSGEISTNILASNVIKAINASIGKISADRIDVDSIKVGNIDADQITSGNIDTDRLQANVIAAINSYAGTMKIQQGQIETLRVGNANITDLDASKITSGKIDANYIDVDSIKIKNANIESVNASKISGGTLDAKDITVTNLNADSITVGQINGRQIASGSISYDKLDSILSGDIRNTIDNVDQALEDVGLVQETVKKTIKSVDVEYAINSSSTTAPTTGWQTAPPTWQNGKFIWSRTTTVLSDGTSTTTDAVCITGATGSKGDKGDKGDTGNVGQGVASITEEYYLSTSKTTQTGGSWTTTPPTWSNGKYMWTRSKIVYKNPTSTVYTTPVCDNSWEAVNDIQIGGRNLILDSTTPVVNSNWSSNGWEGNITAHSDKTYKLVANNGWRVHKYKLPKEYAGKTITISFYAKLLSNETTSTIQNGLYVSNSTGTNPYITSNFETIGNTGSNDLPVKDTWIYYYATVVLNSDCQIGIALRCSPESQKLKTTWLIKELKVEEGNKATSWTPAPEDVQADIESKIDNIQIGGRNLLVGTTTSKSGTFNCPTSFSTYDPYTTFGKKTLADLGFKSGDEVTISFDWKISKNGSLDEVYGHFKLEWKGIKSDGTDNMYVGTISNLVDTFSASNKSGHAVIVTKLDTNSVKAHTLRFRIDNSVLTFTASNVMVEKGNRPSSWVPAPEDTTEEISKVTSIANGKNSVFYSTSAPSTSGKKENDIWFDTDDGHKMYKFSNGSWVATQFGTNAIVTNAITTDKITSSAITAGKIATGAVTTDKLYALSVTSDKVAANAITAGKIATDAVLANNIKAGAITTDKISAKSINSSKLNVEELFVGNNAFINSLKAVEIDASNITTGKISNDRIDINGLVSFEALDNSLKQVFSTSGNKTYINGGMIATNTINADKLNVKGLTVTNNSNITSFAISKEGEVEVNGLLRSSNFDVNKNTGYRISTDGKAILNQAEIRGDVKLPNAGITNYGATIGNENMIKNSNFSNSLNNWYAHDMNSGGTNKSLMAATGGDWIPPNTYVLQIRGTNTVERYGVGQALKLKPNTKYTLTGYCACHRTGNLRITFRNEELSSSHIHNFVPANSTGGNDFSKWTRIKTTFTTQAATEYSMNLYTEKFGDNGFAWFGELKLEEGEGETPWCPHKDEQINYTRFWAGTSFENRDNAPFRVMQNGDLVANRGTFGGTVVSDEVNVGNIHLHENQIVLNSVTKMMNDDGEVCSIEPRHANANPFVNINTGYSLFNNNMYLGSLDNKKVEFINGDNLFNMYKTKFKWTPNNDAQTSIAFNPNGGTHAGLNLIGISGGVHILRHSTASDRLGTMIFDSQGNQGQIGDFSFTRKNHSEDVKVEVDGELVVKTKITGKTSKMEMRATSTGFAFYAV